MTTHNAPYGNFVASWGEFDADNMTYALVWGDVNQLVLFHVVIFFNQLFGIDVIL